jgi:hypothetical protein
MTSQLRRPNKKSAQADIKGTGMSRGPEQAGSKDALYWRYAQLQEMDPGYYDEALRGSVVARHTDVYSILHNNFSSDHSVLVKRNQMTEHAHRRFTRYRFFPKIDTDETAYRARVVQPPSTTGPKRLNHSCRKSMRSICSSAIGGWPPSSLTLDRRLHYGDGHKF